jgi:dihydrofolate reductase
MRRIVLILTISLDGFIADTEGGVDWLATPSEDVPADYLELIDSIDCLLMGRETYLTSLNLPGGTDIFEGKEVIVFTHRDDLPTWPGVSFTHEPAETVSARLRQGNGGTIWLFGGGQLATALADAGLIDEYVIVVQPILLGNGIPLWVAPHRLTHLELLSVREWPGGLAELRYRARNRS